MAAGIDRDAVLSWIDGDPDPETRAELRVLLDRARADPANESDGGRELAERMAGPVRFGTAGLRAPVRAGPNGMNVAVVRRATAGLAAWLHRRLTAEPHSSAHSAATLPPKPTRPLFEHGTTAVASVATGGVPTLRRRVVVGRDARHGSAAFAAATASVLAAAGFDVVALDRPLPTPVLAYAVRALDAVAGVQITASHNPPADNGYKVYLGGADGGAQLVEPADREIEALIAAAPAARDVPVAPVPPTDATDLVAGYLDRLPTGDGLGTGGNGARPVRIAVTPLHGVGGELAVAALGRAGFTDVHLVPEQAEPDPDFPTVTFPNPEEPGATDALLALAARIDADLAVALDPDADRCALGIPPASGPGGGPAGWRMLSGNETGALLGEYLLSTLDRAVHPDPLVATTVASSRLLASIAAGHGARFAETLTGFKWIMRAGVGLVYGFEEALGYCVDPDTVRDKDGIAAAVLAARLASTGPLDRVLDDLARTHGVHATAAITLRVDQRRRAELLARLAGRFGGPAPDVFVLDLPPGRAVVRPSGTEPKLKAYLEVVEPVGTDAGSLDASSLDASSLDASSLDASSLDAGSVDTLAAARDRARNRLTELTAAVRALLDA